MLAAISGATCPTEAISYLAHVCVSGAVVIYGINRICFTVGIGYWSVFNELYGESGQKIYAAGLMLAGLSGDGHALASFGFPMPVVEREDIPCEKKCSPMKKSARVFTAVCRGCLLRRSKMMSPLHEQWRQTAPTSAVNLD